MGLSLTYEFWAGDKALMDAQQGDPGGEIPGEHHILGEEEEEPAKYWEKEWLKVRKLSRKVGRENVSKAKCHPEQHRPRGTPQLTPELSLPCYPLLSLCLSLWPLP